MRTLASLAAASALTLLSLASPALAAETKGVAPLPAPITITAATPTSEVRAYEAALKAHEASLRQELAANRASLTGEEKAALAARLSRVEYALRTVGSDHAAAQRVASLTGTQTAEMVPSLGLPSR
ncbi:hypothetical protein HHL28_08275 [Aerophototrophica crusticola]|uniref:Uncharacterized protein n=1 Tax=Aerophototrophica crusticola TaxID=1709002 RepID=A0A858R6Q1_9PROT|nr:hypothetical protein HHL28_08275 [Rhodospirillaceae bacterium B3]